MRGLWALVVAAGLVAAGCGESSGGEGGSGGQAGTGGAGGSAGTGGDGGTGGSVGYCGDGKVDPGEGCDEGAANDNTTADACRIDCQPAGCGDSVIDTGESCDEGPLNDDATPGACRTDCQPAHCGDGVIDAGESCDDGGENSDTEADACRTSCKLATCGDGAVDEGEDCDEGEAGSATCTPNCLRFNCGDGVVDRGEACDDGAANSDTAPGACRTTCVPARCGDGVTDPSESCDDGGTAGADGCNATCHTETGWICEGAPSSCRQIRCGDGILDGNEACDDGNGAMNDGCNGSCVVEAGWACPTPNAACHPITCGDGLVDNGESCDDGNTLSDDGCTSACVIELPAPGVSIGAAGTVQRRDPFWLPALDDCEVGTFPSARRDAYEVVNTSDYGQTVTVQVDWATDGWLHAYVTPLTGTGGQDGCILGNDHVVGNLKQSRLAGFRIEPGQQVAFVVSAPTATSPNDYQITITTDVPTCGDGMMTGGEACDDMNAVGGDGCSADCSTIEAGYGCPLFGPCVLLPPPGFVINEVDYDNPGSPDTVEYIELYNGSGVAIDTNDYAVFLVDGAGGEGVDTAYMYFNASVGILQPGAYVVIGSQGMSVAPGAYYTLLMNNGFDDQIENGSPDGLALVNTNTSSVIDAVTWGGSISNARLSGFPAGRRPNLTEGTPNNDLDSDTVVGTICRSPNGTDTNDAWADWSFCAVPTPGAANRLN